MQVRVIERDSGFEILMGKVELPHVVLAQTDREVCFQPQCVAVLGIGDGHHLVGKVDRLALLALDQIERPDAPQHPE